MKRETRTTGHLRRRRLGTFALGLILTVVLGAVGSMDDNVSSVHAAPTVSIPPVISNVLAVPGQDFATITWDTDELADSTVLSGTSWAVLDQSVSDATLLISHTIALAGLLQDQTSYYRVISADASATTVRRIRMPPRSTATLTTSAMSATRVSPTRIRNVWLAPTPPTPTPAAGT